jgi:hypothetical protein
MTRMMMIMTIQDACVGADGADVAGKRIRVSYARPRTIGPRNRFLATGQSAPSPSQTSFWRTQYFLEKAASPILYIK